ncbi:ATP-dependent DNA helicase Q1-like isoform X3 [Dendronephthya gigantea]|uniref:ATP-dependent DNA helicase Q1-like isoform X3 n=1 Tax=Dendronephthya gigantea TaxID=151771 RepID=UPI00106CC5AE|nr:ATP-dependent DNA helicase Q1-like isoform X3 [Dendronephthya gigantea]
MADPSKCLHHLHVLQRLHNALNMGGFPSFVLKPLQIKCFEHILNGFDVVAVLPTGFGKSLLFQLLPNFLPTKADKNIVIVVCPLNAIIEDQLKVAKNIGIEAEVLQLVDHRMKVAESLFKSDEMTAESDDVGVLLSDKMLNGDVQLLFTHPEALLSEKGRNLMKSTVFQRNVVACVVDEAHCVEMWGDEFRKDFGNLSIVRAFFPKTPFLALTATAPPHMLSNLKNSMNFNSSCKDVSANPNRRNIFLQKKMRTSNQHIYESYSNILLPIANQLSVELESYPMTVIYMKLKYCGYAYGLFERVLKEKQYVGESKDSVARLFAQFHAPQTNEMKKTIISEVKKQNSRIRVIFATSALGMGVNAPNIVHVIHITPPSSIESYVQEIGRAGRSGHLASATLYYNNSDVSDNVKHVDKSMKEYCLSQETCLRQLLLNYLGFSCVTQERCCCVCEESYPTAICNESMQIREKESLCVIYQMLP